MTLAATTYQWYLAVHILAAVVWVGGAVTIQLLVIRASRPGARIQLASLSSELEWVGTRLYAPTSLILLIFGFLLVGKGDWDMEGWIVVALIVWLFSFVSGVGFLGPQSKKLSEDIERHGPDSAQALERMRRLFLVSRVELVLLILVVLDMVLKPGS